jgi:hypothetical protein
MLINVICIKVIACVDGKEGKKRGNGNWVRNPKSGTVDFEHGANNSRGSQYVQRATIPSKRVIYTLNILKVPHVQ